jgi:hypothetical protein
LAGASRLAGFGHEGRRASRRASKRRTPGTLAAFAPSMRPGFPGPNVGTETGVCRTTARGGPTSVGRWGARGRAYRSAVVGRESTGRYAFPLQETGRAAVDSGTPIVLSPSGAPADFTALRARRPPLVRAAQPISLISQISRSCCLAYPSRQVSAWVKVFWRVLDTPSQATEALSPALVSPSQQNDSTKRARKRHKTT